MDSIVFSTSKPNAALEAEVAEKGFGKMATEKTRQTVKKPSTSLFGGENETGEIHFQSRGGKKQKHVSRSPFGTGFAYDEN